MEPLKSKYNMLTSETDRERWFAEAARRTYRGMASFAGSGPLWKSCGQCEHYTKDCAQYRRMMNVRQGPRFPADTPSCKYFVEKQEQSKAAGQ